MSEYQLSPDVRQLLDDDGVETYEQLEMLMLLAAGPDDSWTMERLSERAAVEAAPAEEALARLTRAGLVERLGERPPRFRYAPRTPELAGAVEQLRDAYAQHKLAVMNQITSNALQRVRTSAMRAFARAFLLRDDRKDSDG